MENDGILYYWDLATVTSATPQRVWTDLVPVRVANTLGPWVLEVVDRFKDTHGSMIPSLMLRADVLRNRWSELRHEWCKVHCPVCSRKHG